MDEKNSYYWTYSGTEEENIIKPPKQLSAPF